MLANFLKQSWLVMVAALVFGLLVAAVNGALKGRIQTNAEEKLNSKMGQLLEGAQSFQEHPLPDGSGSYYVGLDATGQVVGYAVEAEGGGFADKIGLLVAFNADLSALRGIAVLKSNETPGFGDKIKDETPPDGPTSFKDQFRGAPLEERLVVEKTGDPEVADATIVAISGATVSSDAVTKIVNDAVAQMRALNLPRP